MSRLRSLLACFTVLAAVLAVPVPAEAVTGDNDTLNTAAVKAIHARGAKAICYIDAGSIEEFRPDYRQALKWHRSHGGSLLGKPFSAEFPDEHWANINNDRGQQDFLLRLMAARVGRCARAGFDGVEFDVVNAHEAGRSVTGWSGFDFAINEQCFEYEECAELSAFVKAGKPVFQVEYHTPPAKFCAEADRLRFSALKKPADYSLRDKPYAPCA